MKRRQTPLACGRLGKAIRMRQGTGLNRHMSPATCAFLGIQTIGNAKPKHAALLRHGTLQPNVAPQGTSDVPGKQETQTGSGRRGVLLAIDVGEKLKQLGLVRHRNAAPRVLHKHLQPTRVPRTPLDLRAGEGLHANQYVTLAGVLGGVGQKVPQYLDKTTLVCQHRGRDPRRHLRTLHLHPRKGRGAVDALAQSKHLQHAEGHQLRNELLGVNAHDVDGVVHHRVEDVGRPVDVFGQLRGLGLRLDLAPRDDGLQGVANLVGQESKQGVLAAKDLLLANVAKQGRVVDATLILKGGDDQ
eukprot:scaffold3265_cov621-Pavlova_lutheri.AAC.1